MGSPSQGLCFWNVLIPGLGPGKGEVQPRAHHVLSRDSRAAGHRWGVQVAQGQRGPLLLDSPRLQPTRGSEQS